MGRGVVGILLLIALAVASASQALVGEQLSFGETSLIRRRLLSDLKKAQEEAGIFVDDAYLFDQATTNSGRRLQQTSSITAQASAILSNPTILNGLLSLLQSGATVGGFPANSGLPGASAAGYAPTNNSYCLFSTVPNNQTVLLGNGGAQGARPGAFSCVAGTTATPGGFLVTLQGTSYVCTNTTAGAPAIGRRLLAAPAPAPATTLSDVLTEQNADIFFDSVFRAIGVPIWRCIVATSPTGNTTFGQAALATLNDLGVVAEHFLNYLNNANTITYEQNIKNNFVSLTNPLYPTGPRLNFSIDFATVAQDQALFREIFDFPVPASPPPPVVAANVQAPATPTTGGTVPSGSTPSNTGTGGSSPSGGSGSGSSNSGNTTTSFSAPGTVGVTSQTSVGSPAVSMATTTPTQSSPLAAAVQAFLSVFDGYLSNCQVVIGSAPGADGNFDRNNNFQAVIIDGKTSMSMNATTLYNGSVSYIIPASKTVEYAPLTQATRGQAQYCYDIATLLPVYNPIATMVMANTSGMAGNAISTLAVFGAAFGVTPDSVLQALGVSVPAPDTLWTFDALGQSINGSAAGLAFLKSNTQVNNLVTSGASLLTNDSSVYASYAIIINQALARKISYSPPLTTVSTTGRRLLQAPVAAPASGPAAPAVDLTNATTVADILNIAVQSVITSPDATLRSSLTQGLSATDLASVAVAVANLNAASASASDPVTTQLSQYYAQTTLATATSKLAVGDITPDEFNNETSPAVISKALSGTLPGTLIATAAPPAPSRNVTPQTQSSTTAASTESKSGSGLSHGGKVALATVFPIVAVIAIVAGVAFFLSRRNRASEQQSSAVWYRRPFARSGATTTV